MEESAKEQSAASSSFVAGKSKLRYPLRSATKAKEGKTPVSQLSNSSVSKRGRPPSSVSKSVGVLDLSGKDKSSAKPPRRLSVPTKSGVAATPKPVGTFTPISEARAKRSTHGCQGKSLTPVSDVSTTFGRKKFISLASTSYWMSQIKLSESVAKHSISLGFFKLALEAGCEPIQRMRDELKAYVGRHELDEIGETVKELYELYNVADNQEEQVQVSDTVSQIPEEGTHSSEDEVHSSSSTVGTMKLRPRSLNADASQVPSITESSKKEGLQKNVSATRTKAIQNKNLTSLRSTSGNRGSKLQKKPQRPIKQVDSKEKEKTKRPGRKPATEKGPGSPPVSAINPEADKENMGNPAAEEEVTSIEVS